MNSVKSKTVFYLDGSPHQYFETEEAALSHSNFHNACAAVESAVNGYNVESLPVECVEEIVQNIARIWGVRV
jgi:hypothetical protein